MTSNCSHSKVYRVFVLVETSREYGRGLLRGIYRYNSLHKRWQIERRETSLVKRETPEPALHTSRFTSDEGPPPDGIIMRDHRGSPTLLKRGIPIVFASYLHKSIRGSHRILPDDRAVGRMGAGHLLERGFRRFAFVGYDSMYWSQQRQESFAQAVSDAGYACTAFKQASDLRLRVWRKEQRALADWLKTLGRPVGLMACNDDRARQVVDACATAGLAVPEEVAILGVDNDEFVCNLSNPPISSVALGIEDAGYRAAAMLDKLMEARRKEKERQACTRTHTDSPGRSRTPPSVHVRARPCSSVSLSTARIIVPPVTVVTRQSSDISAIEDPSVAEAVRFIRANCRRPIQIDDVLQEVARVAGILPASRGRDALDTARPRWPRQVAISRRSLLDRFKRTLGCTVHQYIKRARVAQIEALLLGTSDSIGQIAETLGFPSSEHVALYFRSVKGMNPHTFREQCRPHKT